MCVLAHTRRPPSHFVCVCVCACLCSNLVQTYNADIVCMCVCVCVSVCVRTPMQTYNADKPMSDLTGTPSFPPTLLPKIQALWDSHADKPKPVDVPPLPALPHDYAAWEGMSDDDDDFVMSEGDWAEAFDEPDGWAFEGMEDDSSDYDDGPM